MERFRDRRDAGQQLAAALARYATAEAEPVVLALPRGGVVVGAEVARALAAPLDVLVARKIGAPGQPEYAIGAIAPDGVRVIDELVVAAHGIPRAYLEDSIAEEAAEMERRIALYREGAPSAPIEGRTVIVVDDGLATGLTASAALASVRRFGPRHLVFAAPVGARPSVERLAGRADAVVVLFTPEPFRAVGEWYDRFEQTTDEEVLDCLRATRIR